VENWTIIKRILWYDLLEYFFIQLIFGYGVHPKRLMIAFLALLSQNSVTKRGYVQKELSEALDILDEFPSSEIFIIRFG
jgi:hypothetical protein